MPTEEEKRNKSRKKTLLLIAIILIALVAIAVNYSVIVRWFIPELTPSVSLDVPTNNEIILDDTHYFNWTGTGGEGPLWYEWYCDVVNTFNSPFLRAINTGHSDSYLPPVFDDGVYYWRVEVTDNVTVNVSSIQRFVINDHAGNNVPYLGNDTVTPTEGTEVISYVYRVTFHDLDNTLPTYVRVYIDSIPFNMVEEDIFDVTTNDGKNYTYASLLSVGIHNYIFFASDGFAVNHTTLTLNPIVSMTSYNPDVPGEKKNKLTIQPSNTETIPTGEFLGQLVITQEGDSASYEVFWYIFLLDENDNQLETTSGSLALQTTVTVAYTIPVDAPIGSYKLSAKTYDRPKEDLQAVQLGTDLISVSIVEEEALMPGLSVFGDLFSWFTSSWLWLVIVIFAFLIPILAWRKNRGWLIVIGLFSVLLLLMLFKVVNIQLLNSVGLGLILLGGILFNEVGQKLIPGQKLRLFVAGVCVFVGILMYFGVFVDMSHLTTLPTPQEGNTGV